MLLEAVIIILREVLEAALLASLLLAISKTLMLGQRWFFLSIAIGLIGAILYAANLSQISQLFDYSGQEWTNSVIQLGIFLLASWVVITTPIQTKSQTHWQAESLSNNCKRNLILAMVATIALAITREFSEILLYLQGFATDHTHFYSVISGSVIGAAIGLSIGVVFFFTFTYRPGRLSLSLSLMTLTLVVSGILGQIAPQLQQIDVIEAVKIAWDSSRLLPEDSVTGQLLYAVLGYEATPSYWHLGLYIFGITWVCSLRMILHQR